VVQAVCCALLENHEKCGTPFIFAANGSRLRVYSPEKCATRLKKKLSARYLGLGTHSLMAKRPPTFRSVDRSASLGLR